MTKCTYYIVKWGKKLTFTSTSPGGCFNSLRKKTNIPKDMYFHQALMIKNTLSKSCFFFDIKNNKESFLPLNWGNKKM